MTSACSGNCTETGFLPETIVRETWVLWNLVVDRVGVAEYQPWIFSLLGSVMVGLSGVFPMFVVSLDDSQDLKHGANAGTLKMLLSFAVGSLLADVFLHLLPEAWANKTLNKVDRNGHRSTTCGLWVLTGFLLFVIAEKIFTGELQRNEDTKEEEDSEKKASDEVDNNNCLTAIENDLKSPLMKLLAETRSVSDINGSKKTKQWGPIGGYSPYISRVRFLGCDIGLRTNRIPKNPKEILDRLDPNQTKKEKKKPKHVSGYLNLMANCIDNFTHGLAVGGSFLVSFRLGAFTTLAILVHEIPHEIGDFAILLKSGFTRWDAARAQLLTATGGILGALIAISCSGGGGVESKTSWILPFTAGGFLHIGMVTVLPELLQESNPRESLKQFAALLGGIVSMAVLTCICD
ncbi:zinc transporter ZIP13 [Orussus abietinus]|uniref:zinc transporter ZIP13 n=1 Tax=Orussus abietinus TaxID=222816 RepID=UPI000625CB7D|nr:zinc transporter ZIP13 [Orussus abietinus]